MIERRNDPKFTISQEEEFIYQPIQLDHADALALFKKTNAGEQRFFLGTIPVSGLPDVWSYQTSIMSYFNIGINWDTNGIDHAYKYRNSWSQSYITDFEYYLKLVWLGYEFCMTAKGGPGFTNPIGIHWNPRTQQFVVHPGIVRYATARLFGKDVYAYYFATKGYAPELITRNMREVNVEELMGSSFFLVPDHGTLIPHITFNDSIIKDQVRMYNKWIREPLLYQGVGISSNVDLNHHLPIRFLRDKPSDIDIQFTNWDTMHINRALVAMSFPFKRMVFDGFTIEKTFGEGELIYEA